LALLDPVGLVNLVVEVGGCIVVAVGEVVDNIEVVDHIAGRLPLAF